MKTKIVISAGWKIIKEYGFLIHLHKGDVVEFEGVEYKVDCQVLEIEQDTVTIILR